LLWDVDVSIPLPYDVRAGKNRRPSRGGRGVAARRTRATTTCGRRAPGRATRHAASGHILPSRRSTPAGTRTRESAWAGRQVTTRCRRVGAGRCKARLRAGSRGSQPGRDAWQATIGRPNVGSWFTPVCPLVLPGFAQKRLIQCPANRFTSSSPT
jgi:hypothetical protein